MDGHKSRATTGTSEMQSGFRLFSRRFSQGIFLNDTVIKVKTIPCTIVSN